MTYLSDREKRKKKIIIRSVIAIFLLVLFIFWLRIRGTLSPVGDVISIKVFLVSQSIHDAYDSVASFFTTKATYYAALDDLEKENDALKQELATLRDGTSTVSYYDSRHLEVHTLFSPLSMVYDTFLISKGFNDGIIEGMIVYTEGYLPIGKVDEVHTTNSRVALLSRNGNEIEGYIPTSAVVIRLTGNGGGDFVATLPKLVPVAIGDTLYMKENPEMKIGQVVAIDNEPQSVSQVLHVRGAYSITSRSRYYVDLP